MENVILQNIMIFFEIKYLLLLIFYDYIIFLMIKTKISLHNIILY